MASMRRCAERFVEQRPEPRWPTLHFFGQAYSRASGKSTYDAHRILRALFRPLSFSARVNRIGCTFVIWTGIVCPKNFVRPLFEAHARCGRVPSIEYTIRDAEFATVKGPRKNRTSSVKILSVNRRINARTRHQEEFLFLDERLGNYCPSIPVFSGRSRL